MDYFEHVDLPSQTLVSLPDAEFSHQWWKEISISSLCRWKCRWLSSSQPTVVCGNMVPGNQQQPSFQVIGWRQAKLDAFVAEHKLMRTQENGWYKVTIIGNRPTAAPAWVNGATYSSPLPSQFDFAIQQRLPWHRWWADFERSWGIRLPMWMKRWALFLWMRHLPALMKQAPIILLPHIDIQKE